MTHKDKVKLATKLRTPKERSMGIGIFVSAAWTQRAESKQLAHNNRITRQRAASAAARARREEYARSIG